MGRTEQQFSCELRRGEWTVKCLTSKLPILMFLLICGTCDLGLFDFGKKLFTWEFVFRKLARLLLKFLKVKGY